MLCSLLLPPLVIGLLLVFMVGPYTPFGDLIGHFNLSATNTFLALVIAEVYESAPYYVVGAQAAFGAVNPRLEQQAALLGDRPWRVFRRVTLPLAVARPGHGACGSLGEGDGSLRGCHYHCLPPLRAAAADLHHAAGDRAWPPRFPTRWSCWWSRCRCRWLPTSGARVLKADVEVDRRDFTVRAAIDGGAGGAAGPVRAVGSRGRRRCWRPSPAWCSRDRPDRAGGPDAHPDKRAAGGGAAVAARGGPAAPGSRPLPASVGPRQPRLCADR